MRCAWEAGGAALVLDDQRAIRRRSRVGALMACSMVEPGCCMQGHQLTKQGSCPAVGALVCTQIYDQVQACHDRKMLPLRPLR